MAFTWYLGEDARDMSIIGGKLVLVSGVEDVRQRVLVSLRHYWQEYFLNIPAGVPWFEFILGSKNKKVVEQILRKAILDVLGVVSIGSMVIDYSTTQPRQLEVFASIEVITIFGTGFTEISSTFP